MSDSEYFDVLTIGFVMDTKILFNRNFGKSTKSPCQIFFAAKKAIQNSLILFFLGGYSELGMERQKLKIACCAGVIFMISVQGQLLDSF